MSLFAEVFNEMLMRDAGFAIYRALVDAPEKVRDEVRSGQERRELSGTGRRTKEYCSSGQLKMSDLILVLVFIVGSNDRSVCCVT